MAKKKEAVDERRHGLVKVAVIGDKSGWGCPACHSGWFHKEDVPDECPLCGTVFDGFSDEVIIIHIRKKPVKRSKLEAPEEIQAETPEVEEVFEDEEIPEDAQIFDAVWGTDLLK